MVDRKIVLFMAGCALVFATEAAYMLVLSKYRLSAEPFPRGPFVTAVHSITTPDPAPPPGRSSS